MHRLRPRPLRLPAVGARRDERGAVALEAALVIVFLFTLLAGVVDLSMFFKATYQLSSGARAGARTAASEPLAASYAQDAADQVAAMLKGMDADPTRVTKIWVYKAVDTGSLNVGEPTSGAACNSDCVKFTYNSTTGKAVFSSGAWSSRSACASGTPTIQSVGVRVEYRYKAMIKFFDGQLITETSTMRFEEIPSTKTCST